MKKQLKQILSMLLALAMALGMIPAMAAEEPPAEQAFLPVADTYVRQDTPEVNYGSEPELAARKGSGTNAHYTFLRYDLSGYDGPADSAIVELKITNSSTKTNPYREQFVRLAVSEVTGDWEEETLTWTGAQALDVRKVLRQDIYAKVGTSCELDLTDYVRQALSAGKTELSLMLAAEQFYAYFASSESGEGPTLYMDCYGADGETGHEAWLRYHGDQLNGAQKAAYGAVVDSLVTDGEAGAGMLHSALEELKLGAKGLLGKDLAVSATVDADGAVVLAKKDSPLLDGLGLDLTGLGGEGYVLRSAVVNGHKATVIAANEDNGLLYGAFRFLSLMQTGKDISALDVAQTPANDYRMLNHWDNPALSIERGYAGLSLFDWPTLPENGEITDPIYREYARANASVGINGIVLNNVNANVNMITEPYLNKIASLAKVMGEYGITLYISLNFGSPKSLEGRDFTWEELQPWWTAKFSQVHAIVPELGGFLIKADSEGQPGPNGYGKGHVDGANMLGDALKDSDFGDNGLILWRAFVYGGSGDRVTQAYNAFKPLDGQFHDNVVIQIKNGPADFQTREAVHPLFGALPNTNTAIELQITQEYTGQDVHNCFLVPQWKEILDFDTYANGEGSTVASLIGGEKFSIIAGVANTAGMTNWTGLQLSQANWYGFGRLAWDPSLTSEEIVEEWAGMTFGNEETVVETVSDIMLDSWRLYESYTSPLGLYFVTDGQHLNPNPSGRKDFNKADAEGIGYPRSSTEDTTDNGIATNNYFPQNRDLYANLDTCPEELLLWFHHVPWTHRLKNGDRLIDRLYSSYAGGISGVQHVIDQWKTLEGKIDSRRYGEILSAFEGQKEAAAEWRNSWVSYLESTSQIPMARAAVPGKFSATEYAEGDAMIKNGALVLTEGESMSYWTGSIPWGTYLPTLEGAGTGTVEIYVGDKLVSTVALGREDKAWSAKKSFRLSSGNGEDTVTLKITEGSVALRQVEFAQVEDPTIQNWALASLGATAEASATENGCFASALIDGLRQYTGMEKHRWKTKGENVTIDVTLPQETELEWVYLFSQQTDSSGYPAPDRTQTTSLYAAPLTVSYWDGTDWVEMGRLGEGENHVWTALAAPEGTVTDKVRVTIEKERDGWMRLIEVEAWGRAAGEDPLHAVTLEGDGAITQVGSDSTAGKSAAAHAGDEITVQTKGNPRAFLGWEAVEAPDGFALPDDAGENQTLSFAMPEGPVTIRPLYDQGKNYALVVNGGQAATELNGAEKEEGDPNAVLNGYRYFTKQSSLQTSRRWRAKKGNPQLTVTLAQPVELYTIGLFSQQNDNAGYYETDREETTKFPASGSDVSYWDEAGQEWKPLGSFDFADKHVWQEMFVPEGIVTDQVRIQFNSMVDSWVRVIELEVWGKTEGHDVMVDGQLTGGTIALSATYAYSGDTVVLQAVPEEGYCLAEDSLRVTQADGTQLDILTRRADGSYTFPMPNEDVIVTARFEAIPTYTVSYALTHVSRDEAAPEEVLQGDSLCLTLTAQDGYDLPGTITVTMDGRELSVREYSYDTTTGEVCIARVKGDVELTAEGVLREEPTPTPTPTTTPTPTPAPTPTPTPTTRPSGDDRDHSSGSGTVKKTVKNPDGSTTVTETRKDGSTKVTHTAVDGVVTVTETTEDGRVSSVVTVPDKVDKAEVTIPVKAPTPGTVAVIVKKDGTEEIVKDSLPTEDGITLTLTGNASIKLIDNAKKFVDVDNKHWAKDDIDFVSSREIFNGTGEGRFSPGENTTRATLFTVLARMANVDTAGGESWYAKGLQWAVENKISDGTNPESLITREQLATLLYRYIGEPTTENADLSAFTDAEQISDWAGAAMKWAVQTGILKGKDGARLDPAGNATRAEVAAMLQRFMIVKAAK